MNIMAALKGKLYSRRWPSDSDGPSTACNCATNRRPAAGGSNGHLPALHLAISLCSIGQWWTTRPGPGPADDLAFLPSQVFVVPSL